MVSTLSEILVFLSRMFFFLIPLLFFTSGKKKKIPLFRVGLSDDCQGQDQVALIEDNEIKSKVRKKVEGEKDRYRAALINVEKG